MHERFMKPDRTLLNRQERICAQGWPGTNSKRQSAFVNGVWPSHASRGQGPYLWDAWGNRYIDFIGALGPSILGYSHPAVNEAVIQAVKNGGIFSLPSHLEVEVAEELGDWLGIEKMRFFLNGSDATNAAIRIARTHTNSLWVESDGYHGTDDLWTSLTPPALGCPSSKELMISKLEDHERNVPINIAIIEPVTLDAGKERKEYLEGLTANVLIYDEIVTGTRVPKGTIAKWWGLKPDIICLGKGLGSGFPISVVGGKREVMDCGEYFLSRTFASHPVSLAACQATMRELKKKSIEDLFFYSQRFQQRLNDTCKEIGVEWVGYGTRCQMNDVGEIGGKALLMQEACKAGILFGTALYYSFAHLEAQLDEQTLNIVGDCVNRIRMGQVEMEGIPPQSSFKR